MDKYVTIYTKSGSLLSVTIYRNEVKTGHTINKYNNLQESHRTSKFLGLMIDLQMRMIGQSILVITYNSSLDDTIGLIQNTSTEIIVQLNENGKSMSRNSNVRCNKKEIITIPIRISSTGDYIKVEIDCMVTGPKKKRKLKMEK